jgi:hypothetical protein
MRTPIILLAALTLVPQVALAEDEDDGPDPGAKGAPAVSGAVSKDPGYVPPKSVPYEGGRIPSYAQIENRPNLVLVGTGLGVFGSAYLASLIYGLATCAAQMECREGSGFLYLPVVGPFITSAMSPTSGGAALAAFDGGVQVLGAAITVAGFVWPKKFVVWQDKAASVRISPTAGALSPLPAELQGAQRNVSAGLSLTITSL